MTDAAVHVASRPPRSEFRDGWPILLAGALGVAVTGVHFIVVSVMMKPLHAAYGWSRGDIAFALTLATVIMSIVHVPVGILLDKVGPRPILVPGSIIFSAGVALLGFAGPALWTWYLAYALFSMMIVPCTAFVWLNAIARSFDRRRGLALSLSLCGSGVLTALIPTIVLHLDAAYGVRGTYFALAIGAFCLTFPFALFCIPRHLGGKHGEDEVPPLAIDRNERRALLLGSRFWRVALAVALTSMCIGVFSVHFQPMLTDGGLTPAAAAKVMLFLGATFILGSLFSGLLFDRVSPKLVAAGAYLLPALASALLMEFNGSFVLAATLGILAGAALSAPVNALSFVGGYYFPVRHYGFVLGVLYGILAVAIGFGGWFAGCLFDMNGNYQLVFVLMIAASIVAALLMLSMRSAAADTVPQPVPVG